MANIHVSSSKLAIVYSEGTGTNGELKTKTKQLGSVPESANPDALLRTAKAFGSLFQQPVVQIERRDVLVISE